MDRHNKLVHTITAWDRKNGSASSLALCFEALDAAEDEMNQGVRVNDALNNYFTGTLLKALLRTEL